MTDNEKRILTLLSRYGPLTKKELGERGNMGWATVVRLLTRLEEAGMLYCSGIGEQPETTGKDPSLFALADRNPLAIGIDVSYSTTHVILTNLKHDILAEETHHNPENPTKLEIRDFLATCFSAFVKSVLTPQDYVTGVGISIPRWVVKDQINVFADLEEELNALLPVNVCVENCNRTYTLYQQWIGDAFALNDFIVLEIRDGVGVGIVYQGELFRGTDGLAGGLSHLTIIEDGDACRCGKRGCLETLINQDRIYQKYVANVLKMSDVDIHAVTEAEMHRGLEDLFSRAERGEHEASAIVQEISRYIGMGIAALLLLFNIPRIIIVADFGSDGQMLLPYLEAEINPRITPDITYSITYSPLEAIGFAQGAPLLILKEFLTSL